MLLAVLVSAFASAARGEQAVKEPVWWNAQWRYRVIVEVIPQSTRAGINTAGLALEEQSRLCRKDGGDVRVVDQNGQVVSSASKADDAGKITVEFQVNASTLYAIYYGNPAAPVQAMKWDRKLGGLYLETRPLTKPIYNWAQIPEEVALNTKPYARKPWRQIYDLENPFGPDEMYLSVYEGTIFCPKTGQYQFATNSDDCSVVYIDDNPSPICYRDAGVPTENWNDPPHQNAIGTMELGAGVHRVRYLHVEDHGGQLARMGWKKPDDEVIVTIPPRAFITTLPAQTLGRQEKGKKLNAFFDYEHLYNLKINNATYLFPMIRLHSRSGEVFQPKVAMKYAWSFSEKGPAASGAEVFREFFYDPASRAVPSAKLTVTVPQMTDTVERPIDVPTYPIQYMDLLMEVETGEPIVSRKMPVVVKLFLKNSSRLPRTFELRITTREDDGAVTEKRSVALPPALKAGQDKWVTVSKEVPLSRENVYLDCSIWSHGQRLLERSVAVLRTDKPFGDLRLDANQRLRDGKGRYATLRLADVRRKNVEPPILYRQGFMRIIVLDNGLADQGSERVDQPSYLKYLEKMLTDEMARTSPTRRLKFQVDRISFTYRGGYPPLERLCDISKVIAKKRPNLILLTTSPEDVVNNIPMEDFRANVTAVIDQVLTQTRAMPILITPPPLPRSTVIARRYARTVKVIGIHKDIPVVDIYSGFMLQSNWLSLFSSQSGSSLSRSLRPNAQGQRLIARMIVDKLLRTVYSSPAPDERK